LAAVEAPAPVLSVGPVLEELLGAEVLLDDELLPGEVLLVLGEELLLGY
jgi:hypothetical protein